MKDNISWTSFCQAMNSIAYWLVQNQKKYKKRDHYQILTLKGNCKDIEKKAKKLGNNKLVAMYAMAAIKDNKSLDFFPNYVLLKNGTQIDKAEYVDMAIRTEAYIRANARLPAIVYRKSTLPDYNDSTMKLDPAAVADTTSGNVRSIWCEDGNVIAHVPLLDFYRFVQQLTFNVNSLIFSFFIHKLI